MTTNVVEKYDSFNSLSFKFPSDAMLLLDVTIRYRANDGSIKEKRLTDINKTIDWNDEFALSKMKIQNQSQPKTRRLSHDGRSASSKG